MIGRVSGQYNLEALNGKKSRRSFSYGNDYASESDNAAFSSFGTLLAKVNAEMKNIPDVRESLVAEFKQKIESGTYNPPLNKLADSLIAIGMLDLTEE